MPLDSVGSRNSLVTAMARVGASSGAIPCDADGGKVETRFAFDGITRAAVDPTRAKHLVDEVGPPR